MDNDDKSKICNIVPSPFDSRDWQYEGIASSESKFPKKFLCDHLRPVKNQGKRGTCVAMSVSCIKEYQETVENPLLEDEEFSPNSLYIYRKTKKSGMYCRNAMKVLHEKGMCREELFPYSRKEPKEIPPNAVSEAYNYRTKSYAKVNTIDGVKTALLNYGPLLIAFPYYKNGKPEFWKRPDVKAKADGGHAVVIVGWNEKGFIIRNSWGAKWNGDGHVLYSYSDWGSHWEIWSCIDLDTNYRPHIKDDNFLKKLLCFGN